MAHYPNVVVGISDEREAFPPKGEFLCNHREE